MKQNNMTLKKSLVIFIGIILASGIFIFVLGKNANGKKRNKERIENLLHGIKYSASPRISIKYCKQILEIDPNNGEAYYKLAEAYKDMASFVVKSEKEKKYY